MRALVLVPYGSPGGLAAEVSISISVEVSYDTIEEGKAQYYTRIMRHSTRRAQKPPKYIYIYIYI